MNCMYTTYYIEAFPMLIFFTIPKRQHLMNNDNFTYSNGLLFLMVFFFTTIVII